MSTEREFSDLAQELHFNLTKVQQAWRIGILSDEELNHEATEITEVCRTTFLPKRQSMKMR